MDYTTLTSSKSVPGSIAAWMNHDQVTTAAPFIIQEAESFIYRRLRHWRMIPPKKTGTLTVATDLLVFPNDMLEPASLYLTGTFFQEIPLKTPEEVIANYAYDGSGNRVQQMPQMYYFDNTNINFDSFVDQTYSYLLLYYQQPVPLATATTNFLTNTYPRLLRCACMAGAAEFMKDAGLGNYDRTYWDQLAEQEIEIAQAESDRAQRSSELGAILV